MKSPIHGRQTTGYQQGGGYENPCNDDDLFHEDSLRPFITLLLPERSLRLPEVPLPTP